MKPPIDFYEPDPSFPRTDRANNSKVLKKYVESRGFSHSQFITLVTDFFRYSKAHCERLVYLERIAENERQRGEAIDLSTMVTMKENINKLLRLAAKGITGKDATAHGWYNGRNDPPITELTSYRPDILKTTYGIEMLDDKDRAKVAIARTLTYIQVLPPVNEVIITRNKLGPNDPKSNLYTFRLAKHDESSHYKCWESIILHPHFRAYKYRKSKESGGERDMPIFTRNINQHCMDEIERTFGGDRTLVMSPNGIAWLRRAVMSDDLAAKEWAETWLVFQTITEGDRRCNWIWSNEWHSHLWGL